jgi:hypothetical protein
MYIIVSTSVRIVANMIAKLGYSFIVVTSPTVDISTDRKNTEYVIAVFILFMFWFLLSIYSIHAYVFAETDFFII